MFSRVAQDIFSSGGSKNGFVCPARGNNSRLCTKGGMVAIVTSVKCTRPSVARVVFTRVTSLACRSRYTRRFVSKLVEKVSLRASA